MVEQNNFLIELSKTAQKAFKVLQEKYANNNWKEKSAGELKSQLDYQLLMESKPEDQNDIDEFNKILINQAEIFKLECNKILENFSKLQDLTTEEDSLALIEELTTSLETFENNYSRCFKDTQDDWQKNFAKLGLCIGMALSVALIFLALIFLPEVLFVIPVIILAIASMILFFGACCLIGAWIGAQIGESIAPNNLVTDFIKEAKQLIEAIKIKKVLAPNNVEEPVVKDKQKFFALASKKTLGFFSSTSNYILDAAKSLPNIVYCTP